jgi:hypothetical protein
MRLNFGSLALAATALTAAALTTAQAQQPPTVVARQPRDVAGIWMARNLKFGPDLPPVTLVLELSYADSGLRGLLRFDGGTAGDNSGPPVGLVGEMVADSLWLRDARGSAFIEGRFDGSRYVARIGMQTAPLILPRLGADAKSVRFERQ